MGEMVERVGRAMCDAKHGIRTFDNHPNMRAHFMALARIAVEAMREPTKEMIAAESGLNADWLVADWQAMIDAALAELTEDR